MLINFLNFLGENSKVARFGGQRGRGGPRGRGGRGGRGRGGKARSKDYDNIRTKPQGMEVKQGSSGRQVVLRANYFRLTKLPDFKMIQYSVNFDPEIETSQTKKTILRQISRRLGGYLYDGNNLYLMKALEDDKNIFTTKDRYEKEYKIIIRKTQDIQMMDDQAFQIFNIILRETMRGLNLELIGRNFFDPNGKVG